MPDRIGILLAAGRSRRMGRLKQLLPWPTDVGEKPLVAAAYDRIASVCKRMIVVVGHQAKAVTSALSSRDFQTMHTDPDAPMFESIRVGLQQAISIATDADVLVHPADHPDVAQTTLEFLLESDAAKSTMARIPCYQGRGGHPVFVPSKLVPRLIEWNDVGGLRQYWLEHPDTVVRLAVDDPCVIHDLDTPTDYQILGRRRIRQNSADFGDG